MTRRDEVRAGVMEGRRGVVVEHAGEPVLYAPLMPVDAWRIRRGLSEMSAETRYLRFFSPATAFTDEEIRVTSSPDQVGHVAWVAFALKEPRRPGLGLARMVRDPADPRVAEMAVAVIDRMQRRGIARVLMCCLLASAARRGVEELRAEVLPSNTVALEWFRAWGAACEFAGDGWAVRLPVEKARERADACEAIARIVAGVEGSA